MTATVTNDKRFGLFLAHLTSPRLSGLYPRKSSHVFTTGAIESQMEIHNNG